MWPRVTGGNPGIDAPPREKPAKRPSEPWEDREIPYSYRNLLYHILYSTHERRAWTDAEVEARLNAYTGGVNDHLRVLARLRPDKAISHVLRVIKAESSGCVHTTFPNMAGFAWQGSYAAFTVSGLQVNKLRRYIRNQGLRHRWMSFQQKVIKLLNAHGVAFEERYLWK